MLKEKLISVGIRGAGCVVRGAFEASRNTLSKYTCKYVNSTSFPSGTSLVINASSKPSSSSIPCTLHGPLITFIAFERLIFSTRMRFCIISGIFRSNSVIFARYSSRIENNILHCTSASMIARTISINSSLSSLLPNINSSSNWSKMR